MPHTTKKEYQPVQKELPKCDSNTEVFYLPSTNEVFSDYDEYFERILQLFSSVWICSVTGKSSLTYDEALESEKEALKQLDEFPNSLKAPVLFLIDKFSFRTRIDDLVNDVLYFIKDRYFLNEEIYLKHLTKLIPARITKIEYTGDPSQTSKNSKENDDEEADLNKKGYTFSPPDDFKYVVQILEHANEHLIEVAIDGNDLLAQMKINGGRRDHIIQKHIRRHKQSTTRPKLKLFVKYCTELRQDHLALKDEFTQRYNIDKLVWDDIHAGPAPVFPQTHRIKSTKHEPDKIKPVEKAVKKKQMKMDDFTIKIEDGDDSAKSPKKSKISKVETKRLEEILKQQTELSSLFNLAEKHNVENLNRWKQRNTLLDDSDISKLREAIALEKEKERIRLLEKRKREKEELAERKKPRDDLLCDDLKPLPSYQQFIWPDWIPQKMYMHIVSIYNFMTGFVRVMPKTQQFSLYELAIGIMSKSDEGSHFFRLMRCLLEQINISIEEEEGEEDQDGPEEISNELNPIYGERLREINRTNAKFKDTHGINFRSARIDRLTITEIARLTLLTSGYYNKKAKRSTLRCFEDEGFSFVQQNPDIYDILAKKSIFVLTPDQRVVLINTLIQILFSHNLYRTLMEQQLDSLDELRRLIRQLRQTDAQHEKEAKEAQQMKRQQLKVDSENKDNSEAAETGKKRVSKELNELRRFLSTYNEGRRLGNLQEMKEKLLEGSLPYDEMEPNEITEFRAIQCTLFNQELELVLKEIFNLNAQISQCFLGRDRAFRTYHFLHHFSAIFIESPNKSDIHFFECEKPTPIEKIELEYSKAESQSIDTDQKDPPLNDVEKFDKETIIDRLLACSGDSATCPVHNVNKNGSKYYFFVEENGIERLLDSLNPRGFREIELAENLRELKEMYSQAMNVRARKFNTENLCSKLFGLQNSANKEALFESNDASSMDDPKNTELVDQLLGIEENIHEKGLGILQITTDRTQWRKALKEMESTATFCEENVVYLQNSLTDEILYTSDDLNPEKGCLSPVQKIGISLLQLYQGVRLECFKDPFVGEAKQDREILPTENYIEWQKGLVRCQSFSAISLFASTLVKAVNWNFISSLANCPLCFKKVYESEKYLSCSSCGESFHWKCVPSKKSDKNSAWKCADCKDSYDIPLRETTSPENQRGAGKRINRRRIDYSPTPSSSSGISNKTQEQHTSSTDLENGMNTEYNINIASKSNTKLIINGTRKRKPVRKYGEFTLGDDFDPGTDSGDSLYEFFGRRNLHNKEKRPKQTENNGNNADGHLRLISMGLREGGHGRTKKELIRLWEEALYEARRQPFSEPFIDLVDKKTLPHYYDIIKNPMALITIIQKIKAYEYDTTEEVWADFELMFNNCRTFNEEGSSILVQCEQLREFVKQKFDAI